MGIFSKSFVLWTVTFLFITSMDLSALSPSSSISSLSKSVFTRASGGGQKRSFWPRRKTQKTDNDFPKGRTLVSPKKDKAERSDVEGIDLAWTRSAGLAGAANEKGRDIELSLTMPEEGVLLDPFERFLEDIGLTESDLQKAQIDVSHLRIIYELETGRWASFRWINLDYLFEKFFHFLFLRE